MKIFGAALLLVLMSIGAGAQVVLTPPFPDYSKSERGQMNNLLSAAEEELASLNDVIIAHRVVIKACQGRNMTQAEIRRVMQEPYETHAEIHHLLRICESKIKTVSVEQLESVVQTAFTRFEEARKRIFEQSQSFRAR